MLVDNACINAHASAPLVGIVVPSSSEAGIKTHRICSVCTVWQNVVGMDQISIKTPTLNVGFS